MLLPQFSGVTDVHDIFSNDTSYGHYLHYVLLFLVHGYMSFIFTIITFSSVRYGNWDLPLMLLLKFWSCYFSFLLLGLCLHLSYILLFIILFNNTFPFDIIIFSFQLCHWLKTISAVTAKRCCRWCCYLSFQWIIYFFLFMTFPLCGYYSFTVIILRRFISWLFITILLVVNILLMLLLNVTLFDVYNLVFNVSFLFSFYLSELKTLFYLILFFLLLS